METFQRIIGGRQKIPVEGFLNFTPLSFSQQRYLTNVYALLATSKTNNLRQSANIKLFFQQLSQH